MREPKIYYNEKPRVAFYDDNGVRHWARFETIKEAVNFVNGLKEKNPNVSERIPNRKLKIINLYEKYVNYIKDEVKETSYEAICRSLKRWVLKKYKYHYISDFAETKNLISFKKRLLDRKYSMTTYKHIFHYINKMFEIGVDEGIATKEEAYNVKKVLRRFKKEDYREPKTPVVLSIDETKHFLQLLLDQHSKWFPFFLLVATCAPRISEARCLMLEDYDPINRTIKIGRQAVVYGGETHIYSPKSENSYRTIGIPNVLDNALKEHIRTWRIRSPKSYLFFNGDHPLSISTINRFLQKFRSDNNLKEITIHTFRRSLETNLLSQDLNQVERSAVFKTLGHTESVGLRHYYIIKQNQTTKIADFFDEKLGDTYGNKPKQN